MPIDRETARMR